MAKLITVTFLLDVPTEAEAADWANETLREMQRTWTPGSDLIDYCVSDASTYPGKMSGYEEGEMAAYLEPFLAGFEIDNGEASKNEILAANPNLISYRVMLHEDKGDKFQMVFDCYAEDDDHAAEQALNAYPNGKVLSTTPFMGNE